MQITYSVDFVGKMYCFLGYNSRRLRFCVCSKILRFESVSYRRLYHLQWLEANYVAIDASIHMQRCLAVVEYHDFP